MTSQAPGHGIALQEGQAHVLELHLAVLACSPSLPAKAPLLMSPRALEAMTLDGRAAAAVPKKRAEPKATGPKAAPKAKQAAAKEASAPATRKKGKQPGPES